MSDNTNSIINSPLSVRLIKSIKEVSESNWDACAGCGNPFISHKFLSALEESESVCPNTGWLPQHIIYEDKFGKLLGVVPLYLKGHSYGEYVFDWGWADAFERAGGRYFPKLLSAIPFTPVTCPKLLVRSGEDVEKTSKILAKSLMKATTQHGVSSLHINFPNEQESQFLNELGFLRRYALQYHWENQGYDNFEAFLNELSARKRKSIKKERRQAIADGIKILMLTGDEIKSRHWDAFYRFYIDTSDRKWGTAYLNRTFFSLLGESMPDRVLLVMAEYDGELVGGALNLIGETTLYGRNWGCIADFKFLHFEACYYRAIDFAIERGLARVEAGAQGQHKIQRGYLPTYTFSNHYIPNQSFRNAVAEFVEREREHMAIEKRELEEASPFRKRL